MSTPRSKVDRLLTKYDLEDIGAELEARWTRPDDRWSLRDLATWFNVRLLDAALNRSTAQSIEGEAENLYRLLTADEVSRGSRLQARRQLERAGIDPDELETEFVSYQAIRTYLKEFRGAEQPTDDRDPREKAQERIRKLVARTQTVTEGQVDQLDSAGHIDVGDSLRALVEVRLHCETCNGQYTIDELLESGGCTCGQATDT